MYNVVNNIFHVCHLKDDKFKREVKAFRKVIFNSYLIKHEIEFLRAKKYRNVFYVKFKSFSFFLKTILNSKKIIKGHSTMRKKFNGSMPFSMMHMYHCIIVTWVMISNNMYTQKKMFPSTVMSPYENKKS